MSEAALAPKMGKVSDEENATFVRWVTTTYKDRVLAHSLTHFEGKERTMAYLFVRALRAGAKLEDLL